VVEEVVFGVELPPLEELFGVVLGTTTVTVTLGVVLVATTFDPGLVFFVGVPPGWKAAYSNVLAGAE
jgi:hypothetical protein